MSSRRLPTTAVVCATLLLAACTSDPATQSQNSAAPNPSVSSKAPAPKASGPERIDSALVQDLLPASAADEPKFLPSRAPRLASFPSKKSTPLLADLPGRAVLTAFESEAAIDQYYVHRQFSDIVRYFYGVDGRWRSLNMAELGISESDFAGSDTGVADLSPTGRYWTFRTLTRVAILDLKTGELTLTDPIGPWRVRPEWGPGGMVVARSLKVGWVLIDPRSGRTRAWSDRPPGDRSMPYTVDGRLVRVLGGVKSDRKRLAEFTNGTFTHPMRIPFQLPGRVSVDFSAQRIAFLSITRHRAVMANHRVTVTDRDANPTAVLPLGRRKYLSVNVLGWANADTLLLYVGQRILAWRPDQGTLHTVTRISRNARLDVAMHAVLKK